MLDGIILLLENSYFWCKKTRMGFPKEPWMPESSVV